MGLTDKTIRSYLDILTATFMVRQLQPWHENIRNIPDYNNLTQKGNKGAGILPFTGVRYGVPYYAKKPAKIKLAHGETKAQKVFGW